MAGKTLVCGLVGAVAIGGMHLLGINLVASLILALFVMVIFATMIMTDDPRDARRSDYDGNESGDALSTRSSRDASD